MGKIMLSICGEDAESVIDEVVSETPDRHPEWVRRRCREALRALERGEEIEGYRDLGYVLLVKLMARDAVEMASIN